MLKFFAGLEPCTAGIEACGSEHYWAREIGRLGHTVKLMPPKYVKPYVKRGKTDGGDAEAVGRPTMRFVAVKSTDQQALAMLHTVRDTLISQRTQAINALRGHLSELGVIAAKGMVGLGELAAIVRDDGDGRLPAVARSTLKILFAQIEATSVRIAETDAALRAEHTASAESRALATVPGIGPVTASALRARVGDVGQFENGTTPGGLGSDWCRRRRKAVARASRGASRKRGDRYLRRLLVSGAMALVRHAKLRPDNYPEIAAKLQRLHPKVVAVALANRSARTAWAILKRGGAYDAKYRRARQQGTHAVTPASAAAA